MAEIKYKETAKRFKKALATNNMTAKELSVKAKISEPAISRYVNGTRRPTVSASKKIAAILHTSPAYLMGLDSEELPDKSSETVKRVKALCEEKGITLVFLEKELGFSNGSIAKVKNMSIDRLYAIARYFNVTPEYLIAGEESSPNAGRVAAEIKERNKILTEIINTQNEINEHYEKILQAKDKLCVLQNELQNTYRCDK